MTSRVARGSSQQPVPAPQGSDPHEKSPSAPPASAPSLPATPLPTVNSPTGFSSTDFHQLDRLYGGPFIEDVAKSPADLRARRDEIRAKLWKLMGPIPDIDQGPGWKDVRVTRTDRLTTPNGNAYRLEHFSFV